MTESAKRPNETEWRELFEHSPLMYFVVDAAGSVLSVNGSGAATLGYHVDELVRQPVFKVFPRLGPGARSTKLGPMPGKARSVERVGGPEDP